MLCIDTCVNYDTVNYNFQNCSYSELLWLIIRNEKKQKYHSRLRLILILLNTKVSPFYIVLQKMGIFNFLVWKIKDLKDKTNKNKQVGHG